VSDRPPTRGRRFLRLASMTASVAGGFARKSVASAFGSEERKARLQQEFLTAAGERLVETLGELKGAAMKLGQMASTASDLLPPEVAEALAKLQKQAPPMAYEVIAEQIEAELGSPPERLFDRFDREPFAAASIGQVHRARTDDGREVVVKVQYPGVDAAVDSDLAHLGTALKIARIAHDKAGLDAMLQELKDRLHEELDYCLEADSVREFRALHADDPWLVVPDVVGERSSARVLTLTFEDGADLSEAATWDPAIRNVLGRRIVMTSGRQTFEFRALHGDPHPGNYAFRPDGTVVLYDFGCIHRATEEATEAYRGFLRGMLRGDAALLDQSLLDLGVRRPDVPSPGLDLYGPVLDVISDLRRGGPFDFGAAPLNERFLATAPHWMRHYSAFRPAGDVGIVKRVVVGLCDDLRELGACVDVLEILSPYLDVE